MNLRHQKFKNLIHSIAFHLTLSYIEKNCEKNLWLVFVYDILKKL